MKTDKLPDVALEHTLGYGQAAYAPIAWVGMKGIETPVVLRREGQLFRLAAKADAFVSLDKSPSRGIHMSRLYLACQKSFSEQELTAKLMKDLVVEFLYTHQDLSSNAKCSVSFDAPIVRKALKSENSSWRNYPVTLTAISEAGKVKNYLEVEVTYSSTCPASAALSRQLIQDSFEKKFANQNLSYDELHAWLGTTQGIVATPHAQRSLARVLVEVEEGFDFVRLIDLVEEALQTAVQGAVKRVDEQEFALRNGQNLMFCEDAGRRVKSALELVPEVKDFYAQFDHVESLHPHSAVSEISKGLSLRAFLR